MPHKGRTGIKQTMFTVPVWGHGFQSVFLHTGESLPHHPCHLEKFRKVKGLLMRKRLWDLNDMRDGKFLLGCPWDASVVRQDRSTPSVRQAAAPTDGEAFASLIGNV